MDYLKLNLFIPLPRSPESEALCRNLPRAFPSPFCSEVHPLARFAATDLKRRLTERHISLDSAGSGKMFGVLVVRTGEEIGYLAGFSGMLGGSWLAEGFVPPVFDIQPARQLLASADAAIRQIELEIAQVVDQQQRSGAVEQLEQLRDNYAGFERTLKDQHAQNKTDRHHERLSLKGVADAEHLLEALAAQSQQERRLLKEQKKAHQIRVDFVQQRLRTFALQIDKLKEDRATVSRLAQMELFGLYRLLNINGSQTSLADLIQQMSDHYPQGNNNAPIQRLSDLQRFAPGGTGDCAAPKLLQYAFREKLQPLALAEFWWGGSSLSEVRHHNHFYPACRGKCGIVLPVMLDGMNVEVAPRGLPDSAVPAPELPEPLYEDSELAVFNKPSGLLSVPGKHVTDSVQSRLANWWSCTGGAYPVHRLDMDTSGCLLVAKNPNAQRLLQAQFQTRRVDKRYECLLAGDPGAQSGKVTLSLKADLHDRPRQLVCHDTGKSCLSNWRLLRRSSQQWHGHSFVSRVEFSPVTGRTHQLRVHAAHRLGLNAPILGDVLYGVDTPVCGPVAQEGCQGFAGQDQAGEDQAGQNQAGEGSIKPVDRLMLHATRIAFTHPVTGKDIVVSSAAPF